MAEPGLVNIFFKKKESLVYGLAPPVMDTKGVLAQWLGVCSLPFLIPGSSHTNLPPFFFFFFAFFSVRFPLLDFPPPLKQRFPIPAQSFPTKAAPSVRVAQHQHQQQRPAPVPTSGHQFRVSASLPLSSDFRVLRPAAPTASSSSESSPLPSSGSGSSSRGLTDPDPHLHLRHRPGS